MASKRQWSATREELIWLAGLLEGEGCFDYPADQRGDRHARIRCVMVDEDVVRKVANIFDRSCRRTHTPFARARGWQPKFETGIYGKQALELMEALLPHMGVRRSGKIQDILNQAGKEQHGNRSNSRLQAVCSY